MQQNVWRFLLDMSGSPIAPVPERANEQHYEVSPEFFELALGKRLKYSGCYWSEKTKTLDQAEEAMLEMTCARAEIEDGMEVLDLGCGWGSLSLWIGQRFPNCKVLAVSTSASSELALQVPSSPRGSVPLRRSLPPISVTHTAFHSQPPRCSSRVHPPLRPHPQVARLILCHQRQPSPRRR